MASHGVFAPIPTRALPKDSISRRDVEHVLNTGYVILNGVFTKAEADEAKKEIERLSGAKPKTGRNNFEGIDTTRIYALLDKTRVFDKFSVLPRVLALNDYFLDPGYMVSAYHTIQINPGETTQPMHHDDGYCQLPRPRPPLGAAILLAFDDFTSQNGATRIIPGSHLWGSGRYGTQTEAVDATCPAGSVIYFIGTTWHGGGANKTEQPRMSATVQYCQPYIRPIENQILAVDPRRLSQIPERIVDMMAYRTLDPFIGYADGLNPVKASERMVQRLQKPLDPNPPAFPSKNRAAKL